MARQRPADYLPGNLIARQDFIEACERRDLGAILRLAKQWGGPGFSASHLARRCEMTVSRVQDYVNGRVQAQRVDIFERVADGLHIPGALLDLAPRPWESTGPANAAEGAIEDGDSAVLRRDFLKLSAGVAATSMTNGRTGLPMPASGSRVGATTLEALRANLARLRRLDDHLGGADTFPLYLAEVSKSSEILTSGSLSTGTRQALQALLAEQAQQAGWAAFDTGWQDKATQLFERSFDAAREASATDLAGNALALRAYQLLSGGVQPLELTDKSLRAADASADPAVKSLLYQRAAWTYAVAGHAQKTAWALGQATEALALVGDGGSAPGWAVWAHSPLELEIMTGRCWAQLRRPIRAVPALESAMSRYSDNHARDKALYLSYLADAYLDAGEVEQAAVVTGHAFDLSSGVSSTRPQQRFANVVARLQPHKSVPEVAELLARRPLDPFEVRS